jgi:perosamine synthetase
MTELALFGGPKAVTAARPRWPIIGEEEVASAVKVMLTGDLSTVGRNGIVGQFEDEFAAKFGTRYALSFSSGTSSIHGACFACGVGPGWEVLTPSYTWMSAITAILHANGTPVFCDVVPNSFHIDPEEIRRKATPRTKAVIVCHVWGVPAPMDEIMAVAREKGLMVIEDCSHAHGGRYRGKLLGTIGDVGCFSLQGSKSMVAGEGGILITNSRQLYERAMIPGHHDVRLEEELTLPETQPFAETGGYWKYRSVPVSMAIAHAQLPHLDEWNAARLENYNRLEGQLKDLPALDFLQFPELAPGSVRGFYGSPCLYDYDQSVVARNTFVEALAAEGAGVGTGYKNWYQAPLLQDMNLFRQLWVDQYPNGTRYQPLPLGALPNTESVLARNLILPAWAVPAPDLVDQYAVAFRKVADNMDRLAQYQREKQR